MWPYPQLPADLVIFNEEILIKKLYFLSSDKTVFNKRRSKLFTFVFKLFKLVGALTIVLMSYLSTFLAAKSDVSTAVA